MAVEHLLCDLHGHIGLSGRDMGDPQPQRLTGRIMCTQGRGRFFSNLLRGEGHVRILNTVRGACRGRL